MYILQKNGTRMKKITLQFLKPRNLLVDAYARTFSVPKVYVLFREHRRCIRCYRSRLHGRVDITADPDICSTNVENEVEYLQRRTSSQLCGGLLKSSRSNWGAKLSRRVGGSRTTSSDADVSVKSHVPSKYMFRRGEALPNAKEHFSKTVEWSMAGENKCIRLRTTACC